MCAKKIEDYLTEKSDHTIKDLSFRRLINYSNKTKLLKQKQYCSKKCRQSDCVLYHSHVKHVDTLSVSETLANEAHVSISTKLIDTTYKPQMTFSTFIIYFLTYLGILLGIDALVLKPILSHFSCCQ